MGKMFKKHTIHFYVLGADDWIKVATHRFWSKKRTEKVSLEYCTLMQKMGIPARTKFGRDI